MSSLSKRSARLWALAEFLDRRNPHAALIWGPGGIWVPIILGDIFPIPLTNKRLWMRRHERRIFHYTSFDLVD